MQNKEEKSQHDQGIEMGGKEKPMRKKEYTLEAEVLIDLDHGSTPFKIFTGMNELLEIIITETNRYAIQKGCNFETTEDEMKVFLGINFIKSSSLEDYWSTGTCGENENIQNVIARTRIQSISPSYRIFTFAITTMTIKMTNPTNSVLLSNTYKGDLLKACQLVLFKVLTSSCASLQVDRV